ncbi:MAG: outer membrane beta-barrel protein [Gemmatimonadota bacterium]|nr:outer membrane beta-barrel protein [Gemmatimonadota bacterium]
MSYSNFRRTLLATIVLGLLGTAPALAQNQWFSLSYGVALPSGPTQDFTDNTSWRNIGADYSWFTSRHIAVGFSAAWNVFVEREADVTTSLSGSDITGTQIRYVNAFPLLVTGRYFLKGRNSGDFDLWLGAGAGAMISENRVDVGIFTVDESPWHLSVAPEAGVVYPVNDVMALFAQGKYTFGFKTDDIEHRYFNINLGFAWRN